MERKTTGTVLSASKQWWLKVNTKPIRTGTLDGAVFPYIIKVSYTVEGKEYNKRKWISAGSHVPTIGSQVAVLYDERKPGKGKIL